MFFDNNQISSKSAYFSSASYSEGLRSHFLRVYNYMAMALSISGLVSLGASKSQALMTMLFSSPLLLILFGLIPIGISIFMSAKMESLSMQSLTILLAVYSACIGLTLAPLFLIYTGESVVRIFFISASVFGIVSFYGYTTKKDLTSFGSFLFMGLIGLIIASIVNIFLKSSMMDFILSIIGLGIFIGLAAFDTQKIKNMYFEMSNSGYSQENIQKVSVMSALQLYLDFINIFIYMLKLFGTRRDE
jgi:FtsH-binding integral membrane protein